jgi:hypothetical protein
LAELGTLSKRDRWQGLALNRISLMHPFRESVREMEQTLIIELNQACARWVLLILVFVLAVLLVLRMWEKDIFFSLIAFYWILTLLFSKFIRRWPIATPGLFFLKDTVYTFEKSSALLKVRSSSLVQTRIQEYPLELVKVADIDVLSVVNGFWSRYQISLEVVGMKEKLVLYSGSARKLSGQLYGVRLLETVNTFLNPSYRLIK